MKLKPEEHSLGDPFKMLHDNVWKDVNNPAWTNTVHTVLWAGHDYVSSVNILLNKNEFKV